MISKLTIKLSTTVSIFWFFSNLFKATHMIVLFGYFVLAKSTGKLFNIPPSNKLWVLYSIGGNMPGIDILHKTVFCRSHFSNKIYFAVFVSTDQTNNLIFSLPKLFGRYSSAICLIFLLDKIHPLFLKISVP
jgi:hypothetical protein